MENKKFTTKKLTACGLIAALMCILAPMSLQIGIIPISFTNLVIYFAAYLLGTDGIMWSYLVYFLLGCFGLPVFSGFSGGLGKVTGPTGGFLIGFFAMAFLSALTIELFPKNKSLQIIGMYLSTFVAYIFGSIWFSVVQHTTFGQAFAACALPFLLIDLVKVIIASFIGPAVAKATRLNLSDM